MTGNGKIEQDAGYQVPPELNPSRRKKPPKSRRMDRRTARLKKPNCEKELLEREEERRPTPARSTRPQSYVECVGLPPTGSAPNAGC